MSELRRFDASSGRSAGRRRLYFFVHIPKCGGTTFKDVMRRNFGAGYLEEYRLLEPRELRYRSEDMDRLADFVPRMRFFAGHCISANLPYERSDIDVVALTIVREPISRILSWYFYNRNVHRYRQLEQELNLEEYLSFVVDEYDFDADPLRWSQVADLVGVGGEAGLERIAELSERRRLLFCPLRRFDEFLCLLERLCPSDFPDCSYPARINVSPRDQEVTPELEPWLQKLGTFPTIQADRKLVELANGSLTGLIGQEFEDGEFQESLRWLRARSVRRDWHETLWRRPARAVRRLLR